MDNMNGNQNPLIFHNYSRDKAPVIKLGVCAPFAPMVLTPLLLEIFNTYAHFVN